jgi:glutaredoxin 3
MDTSHHITVYSTSWCGFCKAAMQYLDSKGMAYDHKDIEADTAAYDELMGKIGGDFRGVPVIDIDGTIILGYDRPKIDAAIAPAA